MAQWIKPLAHKYETLRLTSSTHVKVGYWQCALIAPVLRRWRQGDTWDLLVNCYSQIIERPVSKNKW